MPRMTAQQRDHLTARIGEVLRANLKAIPRGSWEEPNPWDKENEPAEVKKARRVLDAWDEKKRGHSERNRKAQDRVEAPWKKEAGKVTTTVLFGTPEAGLAAVEAYEKKYAKRRPVA